MSEPIRVLLVEDNPGDARLVEFTLAQEPGGPYRLERAARIADALGRLDRPDFDVVLLDRFLPDAEEWGGLAKIRERAPQVPVVVLTGSVDPRLAGEAMGKGAQDYHMKGVFPKGFLGRTLSSAIIRHRVEVKLSKGMEMEAEDIAALAGIEEGVALFEGPSMVYSNAALARISGSPLDHLRPLPEWLPGFVQDQSKGAADPAGAARGTERNNGDFVIERKDGKTVVVEYAAVAFPHPRGRRTFLWMRMVALSAPTPLASPGPAPSGPGAIEAPTAPDASLPEVDEQVLDPTTWARMRELAGGSNAFLIAVVKEFLSEGRKLLPRMWAAARSNDRPALQLAAHTLRSSSAQVGAVQLENVCASLQTWQGSVTGPGGALELTARAEREFLRAISALNDRRLYV